METEKLVLVKMVIVELRLKGDSYSKASGSNGRLTKGCSWEIEFLWVEVLH